MTTIISVSADCLATCEGLRLSAHQRERERDVPCRRPEWPGPLSAVFRSVSGDTAGYQAAQQPPPPPPAWSPEITELSCVKAATGSQQISRHIKTALWSALSMRQIYINFITTLLASLLDVGGEFINFCLVFINYQELISVKLPAVFQVGAIYQVLLWNLYPSCHGCKFKSGW